MRQIFVDSRDRVSGTSTDFSIQLPETLVIEGGHRMRIDGLRLPVVVPTIQTGVNDTYQVLVGATTYTLTIPGGNYDGPTLASKFQGAFSTATPTGIPGSWVVAYDTSNLAMSVSSNYSFSVVGGTYAAQLQTHPYTTTASSVSYTYVTVLGLDMAYLSCSRFATIDTVGPNGAHDTLMSIPITTPYGSVLTQDMPWDTWITMPAMTAQQLDFQLRDRSYKVLSIVPNISFVLTID
jgi:hypothetical protein